MSRKFLVSLPVIFAIVISVISSYIFIALISYRQGAEAVITQVEDTTPQTVPLAVQQLSQELTVKQKQTEYFKEEILPLHPELSDQIIMSTIVEAIPYSSSSLVGSDDSSTSTIWILKTEQQLDNQFPRQYPQTYLVTSMYWMTFFDENSNCSLEDWKIYSSSRGIFSFNCSQNPRTLLVDITNAEIIPITDPQKLVDGVIQNIDIFREGQLQDYLNNGSVGAKLSPFKGAFDLPSYGQTIERLDVPTESVSIFINLEDGKIVEVSKVIGN